MKRTAFLRCFLTQLIKHLTVKTTILTSLNHVRVVVDHTLSSKVKDLALILLISVFSISSLHLLSKSIVCNRFATFYSLIPFDKMLIFSS